MHCLMGHLFSSFFATGASSMNSMSVRMREHVGRQRTEAFMVLDQFNKRMIMIHLERKLERNRLYDKKKLVRYFFVS